MTDPDNTSTEPHAENPAKTGHASRRVADRRARMRRLLALDTTSGVLLLTFAAIAMIWANTGWREAYHHLLAIEVGPESLHLHLTLAHWAADGLLAIFFFVVGVELKHEFVAGGLRDLRLAGVPIAAAVGGMIAPAVVYLLVVGTTSDDPSALHGWATPTATDIAFALAVLAICGRGLPLALRTFLLTLAVVDDLLGIIVIATVYTDSVDLLMLGAAVLVVAVFALAVRAPRTRWWLLLPLAVAAWALMHASGVHATVAGVLLGFVVPAKPIRGEKRSRAELFDETVRPWSSSVALPVFAFASAGVSLVGAGGALVEPVSVGIVAGLVLGKIIGVLGATAVLTRFTPLRLPDAIGLRDLVPIGMLTGVGFTVALLISELSFEDGEHAAPAKAAIVIGSVIAAALAGVLLRWDARKSRDPDMNRDGIPDRDIEVIGG